MRRAASLGFAFAALVALAAAALAASRPAAEQEKIDWLLAQVRESKNVFIRNGSEYGGEKAAAHLSEKLFFKGSSIATASDFIEKVASRSETSGKPYEVRLPGKTTMPLGRWLTALLDARENGTPAAPKAEKAEKA